MTPVQEVSKEEDQEMEEYNEEPEGKEQGSEEFEPE